MIWLALSVLAQSAMITDFDAALDGRDFQGAMELAAGSDSLEAEVLAASGDHAGAALLFGRRFIEAPSGSLFARVWEVAAGSEPPSPVLTAASLREDIDLWSSLLEWSPGDLLSLVESSSLLGDSSLADSLMLSLITRHPLSEEAYEAVSWEFWDGLYPVWDDDSARVIFLEDFIGEWGPLSDPWRSQAYRYILAATLETADSVHWEERLDDWLTSCPEDPQPYLTGAGLFLERNSDWERALELADSGSARTAEGWWPAGMPYEERIITEPALKADLVFRFCQALLRGGDPGSALQTLLPISRSDLFGASDYHTRAPYLWLEGEARLALADTSGAMDAWLEATILGDERNRWTDSSLAALGVLLPEGTAPEAWGRERLGYDGPVFEDVTAWLGPDSLVTGSRVSWCDYDRDGWPDLLAGCDLYRNDCGCGFTLVTDQVFADECRGSGGIWGDIDRDGCPDLVTSGNPVQIFLQRAGRLEDSTESLGVGSTGALVEGVGLADWNADGWLDIYLASYESGLGEGTDDSFYLGGPDGLKECRDSLGMVPFLGEPLCGRGVSPCDFDRDGDVDLFISNYRLQENFLWENTPSGAVNSAPALRVAGHEKEGWWGHTIGSVWGDADGDGDWDLFSANLAHPRYIGISDRSELLLQEDGAFRDAREASGIIYEETHSNPVWGDFDNDGLLDLYITSIYEDRRSFLYHCVTASPRYGETAFLSGSRVFNGWGAASADFDLDGRLDLVVGSGEGPVLLRNVTEGGNWLLVRVVPPEEVNPSGLGCVLEALQGDAVLLRQVSGGSGTTSQDDALLHFGLPSDGPVDLRLYVPGSDSPVWELEGVPPGCLVVAGP